MSGVPEQLGAALADRYAIECELGMGGMATVYRAEDLKHHRRVAIKVLRPDLGAALGPERFLREIEISARLSHPHILPLYDSGEAAGILYYVMPCVEGESLRDRLEREKQLPLEDALRISREVGDALSYAHSRGVVHRDIKPENILLESGHAVVADFGIARAIAAAGRGTLTGTGVAIGTPAYMSPEQAAGSRDVDGRSDLYSLACVLYEMLAGQPPFTGPTVESLVHQHLAVEPRSIAAIRPAVPAGVAAAVQRALAKTPADRFNPVALFTEALGDRTSAAPPTAPAVPVEGGAVRPWRSRATTAAVRLAALLLFAGGLAVVRDLRGRAGARYPRATIAVLPFENLSADRSQAYFAPGLQDELLTQLSKVAALTVISRTSVMSYQGTTKPVPEIAAELKVGSIVEGSVQVAGNRLRVNVQLIDAARDRHVWAEQYDRTLNDAFAVQSDVAQRIVTAVGAALTSAEQGRLAAAPTGNPEAYRLYVQAREYLNRPGVLRSNLDSAQEALERALGLDSGFALAHAALSETHGRLFWFGYDPSPAQVARQLEEAETALRLAPNLPRGHAAMGLALYWGRHDYRGALEEFRVALQGAPNDAWVWGWISAVYRRLGDWNEALAGFEKATQVDPRNANLYLDQGGNTYNFMHRYPEAVRSYNRALELAPDLYAAAVQKGWVYARWQGQLDTLGAIVRRLPASAELGTVGPKASLLAELYLLARQPDSLLRMLASVHTPMFEDQLHLTPATLYAAWALELQGHEAAARAAFDSARVLMDSLVQRRPADVRAHVGRGLALAGLGRRGDALREARWLLRSVEYRQDSMMRATVAQDRALILTRAGEIGPALDAVAWLLASPSQLTVREMQLDPRWAPLSRDPRFQALLTRYGEGASVRPSRLHP